MEFDIKFGLPDLFTRDHHNFFAVERVHMGGGFKGSRVSAEPDEKPADDTSHLSAGPLWPLLDTHLANISQDADQLGRLLPHAQSDPWHG